MLDDMGFVNNLDPGDMVGAAQSTWQQLQHEIKPDLSSINKSTIGNIVFAGMGGSALAGGLFAAWQSEDLPLPFTVVRGYQLPGWVGPLSLVFISSYSGNTEETLSAMAQAKAKNAQIIEIAHGGQLKEIDGEQLFIELPRVNQPRMAVFYGLRIIAEVLEQLDVGEYVLDLESAAMGLKQSTLGWRKDVTTEFNYAKQLAEKAMGKNISIHGGPLMKAAAYKWKISFNESSKNTAFYAEWPEFNHNEFLGWSSHPVDKPFQIFQLWSSFEKPRIRQRFEISNRLLSGHWPQPEIIEAFGETAIEQLLWAVMLGDHVSTYLGILNGQNPEPVDLIEKLKDELRRSDQD